MGCDIHIVLEKKVDNKWLGIWATDSIPDSFNLLIRNRNYEFFSNLADVRLEEGVYSRRSPRGLPDDISELSKLAISSYGSDAHSISHFTVKDFCKIFLESYKDNLQHYKNGKYIKEHPAYELFAIDRDQDDYNQYRVIIYFDN